MNYCPRCIEDWEEYDENDTSDDPQPIIKNGTKEPIECVECGICKDCEHLRECSKSN